MDLSNGVTVDNVDANGKERLGDGPELLAIGIALGSDPSADLNVYYVNYLTLYQDLKGKNPILHIAGQSVPLNTTFPGNERCESSSFISADARGPFTLAHEMVHVLQLDPLSGKDQQGHWPAGDVIKLMRAGGTSVSDTVGGSKRLTAGEITSMQSSSLLH